MVETGRHEDLMAMAAYQRADWGAFQEILVTLAPRVIHAFVYRWFCDRTVADELRKDLADLGEQDEVAT